jgi:hypothetical protein
VASFSLLSAFLSYNTASAGSLPKLYSACMGLLGIWGFWVVSFFPPCGSLDHKFLPFPPLTPILGDAQDHICRSYDAF